MLDKLRILGDASEIHDLIDRVYVVDQGTEPRDRSTWFR